MQGWEQEWIDNIVQWELEVIGTPGLFASLCHADCLDEMGPERFLAWYRDEEGAR